MPRYKLLIERLIEYTPSGEPDHALLVKAMVRARAGPGSGVVAWSNCPPHAQEMIKLSTEKVNSAVKREERERVIAEIQNMFHGTLDLMKAGRVLLHKGDLARATPTGEELLFCALFNDTFICADRFLGASGWQCTLRSQVPFRAPACVS